MNQKRKAVAQEVPNPAALDELETHVRSRLNGRLRDFRLSIRDGGLVLEGRTHSYYVKQLAQHTIMAAADLPIRGNKIDVG